MNYDPAQLYFVTIGWISSKKYKSEDQEFLNKILKRILARIDVLKGPQIVNLYYNLYGKALVSLDFATSKDDIILGKTDYMSDIESAINQKTDTLEFNDIVKVLATVKFQEK